MSERERDRDIYNIYIYMYVIYILHRQTGFSDLAFGKHNFSPQVMGIPTGPGSGTPTNGRCKASAVWPLPPRWRSRIWADGGVGWSHGSHGSVNIWEILGLVNVYIANWKITIFNGKIHYQWPFSIAMLVYQRVSIEIYCSHCWWGHHGEIPTDSEFRFLATWPLVRGAPRLQGLPDSDSLDQPFNLPSGYD